ncbi:MAG TPA: AEC family transporter [Gammaproteobacteria bacterium]|nr:AEC family transporter [Gammaproteobacteria bacterium]
MWPQVFNIVFPVFSIVATGFGYALLRRPDMDAAQRITMSILIPALIFHVISQQSFDLANYQGLGVAALAIVLGSGLLSWPLARYFGYDWRSFLPPIMFTNTGNMGLPVALLAFGQQVLGAAVVVFILTNLLNFTLGLWMYSGKYGFADLFKSPVVVAMVAGLVVNLGGFQVPLALDTGINMLGQASVPMLLFGLGVRLAKANLQQLRVGLLGGLLCPLSGLLVFLLIRPWLTLPAPQIQELALFSVLPPAVLNFIMAEHYRRDPEHVAAVVMFGNVSAVIILSLMLAWILPIAS